MAILYVGIDLAKSVFAVHGVDEAGKNDAADAAAICALRRNKAVFREAVCSSFMLLRAACFCFNRQSPPRPSTTNTNTACQKKEVPSKGSRAGPT